jgi:type I restriction enzyme, S subunit
MGLNYQEYPFALNSLPTGWAETTVGEIAAEIKSGFSSGKHNELGHGIPHFRPMNVSASGEIALDELRYISESAGDLRLADNDVLFTNTSSTLWVGKTAVVKDAGNWAFSNHMTRIRVLSGASPEFVARQLHYLCMSGYFAFHCKKYINQSSIPASQLAETVPFRLPPQNEQSRILKKLEELLERGETLTTHLIRLKSLIQKSREAILTFGCCGRLVPTEDQLSKNKGEAYQSAVELLKSGALPDRPRRFKSRNQETIDVGHPALSIGKPNRKLPVGWTWVPLIEIAKMESGHTPSRRHPDWWQGNIPWVSIPDARENHGKAIFDTSQHTNETGLKNSAARLLPKGTVCVSRTASVGYVVMLGCPMATSQDFVNWIPTDSVLSDWLRVVFMSDRPALIRFGKGAIHTTIYFSEWTSMFIALPPLAEQKRIVLEIDRRMSGLERVERQIELALDHANRLRASIFHRAMAGDLEKQDSLDEPVSQVLIRMKNERAIYIEKQRSTNSRRKMHMTKHSLATVKEAIKLLPKDRFSFEDLIAAVQADYDPLKDFVFELLSEKRPSLKQVFDRKTQQMMFQRIRA